MICKREMAERCAPVRDQLNEIIDDLEHEHGVELVAAIVMPLCRPPSDDLHRE